MNIISALFWAMKNQDTIAKIEEPINQMKAAGAGLKAHSYGSTEFVGKCLMQLGIIVGLSTHFFPAPYDMYMALAAVGLEGIYTLGRSLHKWGKDDTSPIVPFDLNAFLAKVAAIAPAPVAPVADQTVTVNVEKPA